MWTLTGGENNAQGQQEENHPGDPVHIHLNTGMFPEQSSDAACEQGNAAEHGDGAQDENPSKGKDLKRDQSAVRICKLWKE